MIPSRPTLPYTVLVALLLALLGLGCAQGEETAVTPPPLATTATSPRAIASQQTPKPAGQPILADPTTAPPQATAVPPPTTPPQPTPLPLAPREWTLYTNPNTIRQLAELDGQLYAATGGGVVRWDLATGAAVLSTSQTDLPSHDVTSITTCGLPTPRIVAGTSAGLALYDPATDEWEIWHTGNQDMAGDVVETVACLGSPGGQILAVGYDLDGMDLYDPRTQDWANYSRQTGLASDFVRHIALTANTGQPTAYFVVSSGFNLTLIGPTGIETYDRDSGLPNDTILDVATTADGRIWLATLAGLIWGDGSGTWTLIPSADIPDLPLGVLKELQPVGARLWIVTSLGQLCLFDPSTNQCTTTHVREPGMMERGSAVFVTADGSLVYASEEGEGIRRLVNGAWQPLVWETSLPTNHIQTVAEDEAGQIWLATDKGLLRLPSSTAAMADGQLFSRATGDEGDLWTTLFIHPAQKGLWLGSYNGLVWFDGQTEWRRWRTEEGLPDNQVRVLTAAPDGRLWVGTNTALSAWDGNEFTSYPLPNAPLSLLATAEGVWIGTQGSGLLWLDEATAELEPIALDGQWLLSIAPAPNGQLWLGESRFIHTFDPATGLLAESLPTQGAFVNSLQVLPSGEVWAAVENRVFFWDGATWQEITDFPHLPRLNQIFQDSTGTVWLAGYSFNEGGGGLAVGR